VKVTIVVGNLVVTFLVNLLVVMSKVNHLMLLVSQMFLSLAYIQARSSIVVITFVCLFACLFVWI